VANSGTLIVGCGFTGRLLAQQLAFEGHAVYGTSRSEAGVNVIRTRGANAVVVNAPDFSAIDRIKGKVTALVTMMPPTMERDGTSIDHNAALMAYVKDWGLTAVVYVSSTSVYGDQAGAVVNEATPCTPDSPRGEARLEIERQVLESGLPAMVVRPAGIYGRFRSQFDRFAGRRARLIDGGRSYTNRIHVRDLAAIIAAACDRGEPGAIYLGTDARPSLQAEVAAHIVETYGLPQPAELSLAEARVRLSRDVLAMIMGSKRLDGSQTLERLGLTLRFPDYVAGLAEIWRFDELAIRAAMAAHSPT
jgi:nucleoside-diphosphate-sugar epimerase